MNLRLECIPCLIRHGYDISDQASSEQDRERFLREVLAWASTLNYAQVPPLAALEMYDMLRRITGVDDPFARIKERSNAKALQCYPLLKQAVAASHNPFDTALRIALAGNMIDYGRQSADGIDMERVVKSYLEASFALDHRDRLRRILEGAKNVLYILDNAGEIVFDRVFIEQIGPDRVTCAVRAEPIINDVTLKDAKQAGLTGVCRVMSSGSGASGTPIAICTDEFREVFAKADLVIAKGQGNYESLHEEEREVFHLFVAKCPVISREVGVPEGSALAFFNNCS